MNQVEDLMEYEAEVYSDEQWRATDFYGENFVPFLEERGRHDLVEFWRSLKPDVHMRFSKTYAVVDDGVTGAIAELASMLVRDNPITHLEAEMFGVGEYDDYDYVSRAVYIGILDDKYIKPFEKLSEGDKMNIYFKLMSTVQNPSILAAFYTWDHLHILHDLRRLRDKGCDREGVRDSLARKLTANEYAFSCNYFAAWRSLRGASMERVPATSTTKSFYRLKLPTGDLLDVMPDPVMGAPLYIKDAEKFADILRNYAGPSAKITVLPGGVGWHEMVGFILHHFKISYLPNVGITCSNLATAMNSATYFKGRELQANKILDCFKRWASEIQVPFNLNGARNIPALVHYILHHGSVQDPTNFVNLTNLEMSYSMKVSAALKNEGAKWRSFQSLKEYGMALSSKMPVPVDSMGKAVQMNGERRADENKVPELNRLFSTTDASMFGPQDPICANASKYGPVMHWVKKYVPTAKSCDIYGYGGGGIRNSLETYYPDCEIRGYDRSPTKAALKDGIKGGWTMGSGYVGDGDLIFDSSFGENEQIDLNNRLKVGELRKRILSGSAPAGGFIKFTFTKDAQFSMGKFPYEIESIASMYEHFVMMAPGHLHSPEVFVCFAGPRRTPVPVTNTKSLSSLIVPYQAKIALIHMGNLIRGSLFWRGVPIHIGPLARLYFGKIFEDACIAVGFSQLEITLAGEMKDMFVETKAAAAGDVYESTAEFDPSVYDAFVVGAVSAMVDPSEFYSAAEANASERDGREKEADLMPAESVAKRHHSAIENTEVGAFNVLPSVAPLSATAKPKPAPRAIRSIAKLAPKEGAELAALRVALGAMDTDSEQEEQGN